MTDDQLMEPISPGLFDFDDGDLVLLGSRRDGGAVCFPAERAELFDGDVEIVPVRLATEGTLYTFTSQEFAPPLPYLGDRSREGFAPYLVGYIELAEGMLVESLLVNCDRDTLRIGRRMRTVPTEFTRADGTVVRTFAFEPADEKGSEQ